MTTKVLARITIIFHVVVQLIDNTNCEWHWKWVNITNLLWIKNTFQNWPYYSQFIASLSHKVLWMMVIKCTERFMRVINFVLKIHIKLFLVTNTCFWRQSQLAIKLTNENKALFFQQTGTYSLYNLMQENSKLGSHRDNMCFVIT